MASPRPKPTALKILQGNPGKRPLPKQEPQFPISAVPEPPAGLAGDEVACAEWRRLEPLLRQALVMTEGDWASLLALCQQWSRYLAVRAEDAHGSAQDKPLANCLRLWVELGLTPSSRSRVVTTGKPQTTLEAFLREA